MLAVADDMATRSLSFDAALQELASLLTRIQIAQLAPQAVADDLPDSNPQTAVVSSYASAYRNLWKSDVSHFGGCAFDALILYLDAVKRAGSTDKAKVRDALEQTKGMVLTAGTYNMSSTDHMGLDVNAYPMLEIRNGGWSLAD